MDRFFLDKILTYIFPPKCGFCNEITETENFICGKCKAEIRENYDNRCKFCGKFALGGVCTECKHEKIYYDELIFCYEYSDLLKEKIHAYKFFNQKHYYHFFSELLLDRLKYANADLILPVPISKERRYERGYNQTELIARNISRKLGIEYNGQVLYKKKNSERQSLLDSRERRKSVKDIFGNADNIGVSGKSIILVDDILTTGATANECSRVLKEDGAKNVIIAVICISHTLK